MQHLQQLCQHPATDVRGYVSAWHCRTSCGLSCTAKPYRKSSSSLLLSPASRLEGPGAGCVRCTHATAAPPASGCGCYNCTQPAAQLDRPVSPFHSLTIVDGDLGAGPRHCFPWAHQADGVRLLPTPQPLAVRCRLSTKHGPLAGRGAAVVAEVQAWAQGFRGRSEGVRWVGWHLRPAACHASFSSSVLPCCSCTRGILTTA